MRFCRLTAAHQRNEQRVLNDFALGATAPNTHDIMRDRLEDLRTSRVIVLGKSYASEANGRDDGTCRKFSGLVERFESDHALLDRLLVASGCRNKSHMEV